jgi:phage terminase large subunit-like protein
VLADASARGLAPLDWAGRAVSLARQLGASLIIAEANQGGEMVRQMLDLAGAASARIAVQLRHARLSKTLRAHAISSLYTLGRVRHAGVFRELEDEMCTFVGEGGPSPDRLDAMVWAVNELAPSDPGPTMRTL